MAPLLSTIILVFNRREALARTLAEVSAALERLAEAMGAASGSAPGGMATARRGYADDAKVSASSHSDAEPSPCHPNTATWRGLAEIIVVDNASTDGSTEELAERVPHCRVLRLEKNTGVAAFNRGVEAASGKYVLILDDDAWPAGPDANPAPRAGPVPVQRHERRGREALVEAMAYLEGEPEVAAVMLQPVHPRTGALEWPFDRVRELTRDWPDLRCANLVRRDAWEAVGGYEEGFFLYRNDTDLALKLLGSGWDVAYNPAWRAMHDSPHIAVRRVRWFYLSTRNWCWMCRRHARGAAALWPALMGWVWAHRLAGVSPARHWAALRGGLAGLLCRFPAPPACVQRDGRALRRLIQLKRALRG